MLTKIRPRTMAQLHCAWRHRKVTWKLLSCRWRQTQTRIRLQRMAHPRCSCRSKMVAWRSLRLLRSGKDTGSENGATPLIMASQEGHLEDAWLLLEANAGKDKIKNHAATPVFMSNCKIPVLQKWKPPTFTVWECSPERRYKRSLGTPNDHEHSVKLQDHSHPAKPVQVNSCCFSISPWAACSAETKSFMKNHGLGLPD